MCGLYKVCIRLVVKSKVACWCLCLYMYIPFQDMTSRELFQQRSTLANGDTTWRLSPLVTAAIEGRLAVLDGVHRLDTGTLGVLKRYHTECSQCVCTYVSPLTVSPLDITCTCVHTLPCSTGERCLCPCLYATELPR